MTQHERPYALWFLPQAQRATVLKETVCTYSSRFSSPLFEPHVTVYGGTTKDLSQTIQHFYTLSAAPMALLVTGFFQSEIFTQTFGLCFAQHSELRQLSEQMKQHSANGLDRYRLKPHLSLIYAALDEAARKRLIDEARIPQSPILFDRLSLVTPGVDGDWHRVSAWQEHAQRNL